MKSVLAGLGMALSLPALSQDPSAACFNQLEAQQQLVTLRPLIALGNIKNQSMEMMTNTRFPTSSEKDAIRVWVKERDQCYVAGEIWRLENMPGNMRSVLDNHYAKNKLLIADLYLARITYGEFANKRSSLSSELTAELNDTWQRNQGGPALYSANDAVQERRLAARRAAMLATATRIFDSSQTDAVWLARQSDCTSERYGAYTYTICR